MCWDGDGAMEKNRGITSKNTSTRRMVRRLLLATMTILGVPAACADDLNLLINGHAHHINAPANTNYNERNTGAGFQYDFDNNGRYWTPFITASGFNDSNRNMSYYAGGGWIHEFEIAPDLDNLHVGVGVVAFLMTRKDFNDNQPFFGALPVATVGTDRAELNITYIPSVHPKFVALWFFQLKIKVVEF
jgi:hypothetical protein